MPGPRPQSAKLIRPRTVGACNNHIQANWITNTPASERRHPRLPIMGTTHVDVEIKGVRVLVVEVDTRALLKRILEDSQAIVLVAGSADEAIELLQAGDTGPLKLVSSSAHLANEFQKVFAVI
jgi:hypothetical protein